MPTYLVTLHSLRIGRLLQSLKITSDSFVIVDDVLLPSIILGWRKTLSLFHNGYLVRLRGDPFEELHERRSLLGPIVNFSIENSIGVFYVSRYLRNKIAPRFPKIIHEVVHNGVDTHFFSPNRGSKEDFIRLTGSVDETTNIVILMTLDIQGKLGYLPIIKGILNKLLREYDFRVFFIGDGQYFNEIKQAYSKLGNVYFLGALPRAKVSRILPLFDIFFYPSSMDAFPNAILEASACGLPVLSTSVGGIQEIVIHGKTGLLVKDLEGQTLRYLKDLIDNDSLRKSLGQAARRSVIERFSWSVVNEQFWSKICPLIATYK